MELLFGIYGRCFLAVGDILWAYLIDGVNGMISPIPERLDKICKVFAWLSRGPKVTGKAVERILGHAVHICLLRRELLSIF